MNGRQRKGTCTDKYRDIMTYWNYNGSCTVNSRMVWDTENFRSLVFVAHSVGRLFESYHWACCFPQMTFGKSVKQWTYKTSHSSVESKAVFGYIYMYGSWNSVVRTVTSSRGWMVKGSMPAMNRRSSVLQKSLYRVWGPHCLIFSGCWGIFLQG